MIHEGKVASGMESYCGTYGFTSPVVRERKRKVGVHEFITYDGSSINEVHSYHDESEVWWQRSAVNNLQLRI